MRDGHIELVGTPMAVFNNPANTFVASFIGSPPMKPLPAAFAVGAVRLADGTSVSVPMRRRGRVQDGQTGVLCIRPDDIYPVGHGIGEAAEGTDLTLTVALAGPPGMESLFSTSIAGQEVQAKLCGLRIVQHGDQLTFRLALERAHLFDATTTRSLEV